VSLNITLLGVCVFLFVHFVVFYLYQHIGVKKHAINQIISLLSIVQDHNIHRRFLYCWPEFHLLNETFVPIFWQIPNSCNNNQWEALEQPTSVTSFC